MFTALHACNTVPPSNHTDFVSNPGKACIREDAGRPLPNHGAGNIAIQPESFAIARLHSTMRTYTTGTHVKVSLLTTRVIIGLTQHIIGDELLHRIIPSLGTCCTINLEFVSSSRVGDKSYEQHHIRALTSHRQTVFIPDTPTENESLGRTKRADVVPGACRTTTVPPQSALLATARIPLMRRPPSVRPGSPAAQFTSARSAHRIPGARSTRGT